MIYGMERLNGVHPWLWAGLAYLGYKSKFDWKVVAGQRDNQAELYAVGRDSAGNVTDSAAVVTDAKPGQSAHEFGLAIDVYPTEDKGRSIVLDKSHAAWAEKTLLLKAFPRLKTDVQISSGVDLPHVEVLDWRSMKEWKLQWAGFAAVVILAASLAAFSR